ncbi:MAG: hypothetical protein ACYCQJ_15910 [Nitrososphaerales archaeon]
MGTSSSRLDASPPWLFIGDMPVRVNKKGQLENRATDNYSFQLAGKVKLIKRSDTRFYYLYRFSPEMKKLFDSFLKAIKESLKLKPHVFGYDEDKGTLWIHSKEEVKVLTFSAHCSLHCGQVIRDHCVLHVKFERIMPYRNYASVMSVCGNHLPVLVEEEDDQGQEK